ncbi:MAG: hypothetical protein RLZZ455_906 [Candidatus Parcubacteria bacterium]|jgi:hypothetical protein
MEIWTTFFPKKIAWELTHAISKGRGGTSDWLQHTHLIEKALGDLRVAGIKGVRLIITPGELTDDGRRFNWSPVEKALTLCSRHKFQVDFCLGPFQYAHFPGIRLPSNLVTKVNAHNTYLDDTHEIREYGMRFLQLQMQRYGVDTRIRGFYLGNEWPDQNSVEGNTSLHIGVSREFMMIAAKAIRNTTTKPVLFNTNIDPSSSKQLYSVFRQFLTLLGTQMRLGFDPYPSRERWNVSPLVKVKRYFASYASCMEDLCVVFDKKQLFFAEVEAQPWGHGESWYSLIKNSPSPQEKIYDFHRSDLQSTFTKYILPTGIREVSLWSPEFWLVAKQMGINWPLDEVRHVSS